MLSQTSHRSLWMQEIGYGKFTLICTGLAVGAGWQTHVACVNIACYYLFGIPLGITLAYILHVGVRVLTHLYFPFSHSFLSNLHQGSDLRFHWKTRDCLISRNQLTVFRMKTVQGISLYINLQSSVP